MDQVLKAVAVIVGVVLLGIAVVWVAGRPGAGYVRCSSCGVDRPSGEFDGGGTRCGWCVDLAGGEQAEGGDSRG